MVKTKIFREANKEKINKRNAEYRLSADPLRMAANKHRHYLANIEKIKKRAADWVVNNIERKLVREKQYRKDNPEKFVNAKAIRRIRVGFDKLPYGTIPKQFAKQNGKCACCGVTLDKYHVDHIMPLALGGRNIAENIQLLTPRCNLRKSAKHPDVWKAEKGLL